MYTAGKLYTLVAGGEFSPLRGPGGLTPQLGGPGANGPGGGFGGSALEAKKICKISL